MKLCGPDCIACPWEERLRLRSQLVRIEHVDLFARYVINVAESEEEDD